MTFNPGDKRRLWELFHMDQTEMSINSLLQSRMDDLERFDTTNSTTLVADVQAWLDDIDTLNEQITTSEQSQTFGAERIQVDGEYSITYATSTSSSGGVGAIAGYKKRRMELTAKISQTMRIVQNPARTYRA